MTRASTYQQEEQGSCRRHRRTAASAEYLYY